MALYLKRLLKDAATRLRVLHVAPDPGLYIWLRRDSRVDYMATDLDRRRYRHIADFTEGNLMHLPFKTGEFDLVICSHVPEHVPDDRKAMSEILRVLKPLGQAMLMVPMATDGGEIDEDPAIVDAAERDRRFGQWDHVRLYTPDEFARRLEATGFQVERYAARDLQPDAAESASIDPDELLMIGRPKV
jgi:SAM-dependent methyltransferase